MKMKIAILTSGILPVPAVQGGAVENLIDFYLAYNNEHHLHDITIYSVWHPDIENHHALNSKVNHYIYIKVHGLYAKLKKKWYQVTHKKEYYHYTIEFYLHEAMIDISKKDFDIIIMENRPAYALKIKEVTNAQIVYHLHNEKLDEQIARAQDIYNAASLIITVSDFIKRRVQTINPKDTKIKTIHNGINLSAFSNLTKADRSIMGFKENDFILVFSGRINRDKGIMELIDAMNLLKDYSQIKLMVIGSTFFGNATTDDDFTIELKEKAKSLKERIVFTGFIPYSMMPKYLKMADIAVIPSLWNDPFPTTVLEAQAMGLPIITTCRGGIPEEVTDKNAILLYTDERFVENLAKSILDLYQSPEKCKEMSEISIRHSRLFNKDNYSKNFFDAISELYI